MEIPMRPNNQQKKAQNMCGIYLKIYKIKQLINWKYTIGLVE